MVPSVTLRVVTFNMLASFLAAPDVPAWEERAPLVAEALRSARADLIGLQEAMPDQCQFLRAHLPDFTLLAVRQPVRDRGLIATVHQRYGVDLSRPDAANDIALALRTAAFALLDRGHFWLSPTPDEPSVGFGNVAPRLLLWLRLRHVASGRVVLVANTHVDWRATLPMLEVCCDRLAALLADGAPAIFMGDFNVGPASAELRLPLAAGWRDAGAGRDPRDLSAPTAEAAGPRSAPEVWMLRRAPPDPQRDRIDHILYRGTDLAVRDWWRVTSPDPTRRLSDHDPICVDLSILG